MASDSRKNETRSNPEHSETIAEFRVSYESLAERCEQATGPDCHIDVAVWLDVVATSDQRELIEIGRRVHGKTEVAFRISRMMDGFNPTASLDAAMTLVPETAGFTLQQLGFPCIAQVFVPQNKEQGGYGATPALALCAAALRARDAPITNERLG